ncbi:hypothetical protein RB2150_16062 [Rhodobacterales bacterium HTCC2150]|nr:hypothetical protein RB2150_16062 [Rhodobacterales bacterium HTCC2150] [Rhodobacteraceae bacterium HTCC2150]
MDEHISSGVDWAEPDEDDPHEYVRQSHVVNQIKSTDDQQSPGKLFIDLPPPDDLDVEKLTSDEIREKIHNMKKEALARLKLRIARDE